jgi:hypothetical protein
MPLEPLELAAQPPVMTTSVTERRLTEIMGEPTLSMFLPYPPRHPAKGVPLHGLRLQ